MTTLTARQRTQIAQVLSSRGIDPHLFRWEWIPGEAVGSVGFQEPCLRLVETEFTFSLYQDSYDAWCVVFSPGQDQQRSVLPGLSWEGVLAHVEIWAIVLDEELASADPWALAAHVAPRDGPIEASANVSFSDLERSEVARSIDQVLSEFRTHAAFSAEQFGVIEQQFAEMKAASERVGKKDWATMALGTILSTVASATLDPAQANRLWSTFSSSLAWLATMPLLKP